MGIRENTLESEKITINDYTNTVENYERIRNKLEQKLANLDNLELFGRIIFFKSAFDPRNFDDYKDLNKSDYLIEFDNLINSPNYLYAIGLSLKNKVNGNDEPSIQDFTEFLIQLNLFYEEYAKSLLYFQVCSKDIDEGLVASSKHHYLINQQNKERYPFQTKELLEKTFGAINDYFLSNIGFDTNDAMEFGEKIIKNFQINVSEKLKYCKKIDKKIKNYGTELQDCLFKNSKKFIEIEIISFCKNHKISSQEKFQRYLDQFSCSFGDGNQEFVLPIDDNIIHNKPLIKFQSKYYCPDPNLLFNNLPEIFEEFLENEKKIQSKIWISYSKRKKEFTEKKVSECFSRIFPKDIVYSNLLYIHKDASPDETDHIIPYCNNILIIEDKSGKYTTPARRGGKERIKSDLKKLIENSYEQGMRCRDYIKSSKKATFSTKKQQDVLKIKFESEKTNFILINVTLEHLYNFSSIMILKSLNLFRDDEFLWSISLFDLDLITRFFSSQALFIHYIESRLRASTFFAFDEISFLGYYMQKGNFIIIPINGKIPYITITPEFIAPFDQYFLGNGDKPEIFIEKEILKIIQDLEKLLPDNFTNLTNAILNLNHESRKDLIKGICYISNTTAIDGKRHDCSIINSVNNIGITVFTQIGRENLLDNLLVYCQLKKYQSKINCWVGLGIDVLDKTFYVHEFVYLDAIWKKNNKFERALANAIKYKMIGPIKE